TQSTNRTPAPTRRRSSSPLNGYDLADITRTSTGSPVVRLTVSRASRLRGALSHRPRDGLDQDQRSAVIGTGGAGEASTDERRIMRVAGHGPLPRYRRLWCGSASHDRTPTASVD